MLVLAGAGVVIIAVLGGYLIEGGSFLVLMQVAEFLIIGGAAAGALLISTPPALLKKILSKVLSSFKGNHKLGRQSYLDLLKLMYELFQLSQKEGVLALETHIEKPESSSVFSKYPEFVTQSRLVFFLTDTIRLVLIGGITPHEIEAFLDTDIETHHQQGIRPGMILQKIGDSMPGLGIVAAVLGIVITMQAINGPAEQVGHKVAAALVGTFLGVLLSYGFIQPLATNLDLAHEDEARMFEVMKAGLVAYSKGLNPMVAVEFGRRSIYDDYRPTFQEMEVTLRGGKK